MKVKFNIGDRVGYYQANRFIGFGVIEGTGYKNEMRVYDVKLDNGKLHWGYEQQFVTQK